LTPTSGAADGGPIGDWLRLPRLRLRLLLLLLLLLSHCALPEMACILRASLREVREVAHVRVRTPAHACTRARRDTTLKLNRKIEDLEDVRGIMAVLKEVREKESEIDNLIGPIEEMYALLLRYEVRRAWWGASCVCVASWCTSAVGAWVCVEFGAAKT